MTCIISRFMKRSNASTLVPKTPLIIPEPSLAQGFFLCGGLSPSMTGAAIITPEGIEAPIDTAEAASLCGVAVETIRTWVHRGLLTACDHDGANGRPRYRLLDVAKAERATREKARR